MKIIFNTDQIYLHGGIEKVMATKANYFASLPDYEVIILTTEQNNNASCYALDNRIKQIDLEINYIRTKSYFSSKNLKKIFKHFFKQKKMFEKLQPDFVISANFNFDHYWLPFIMPRKSKVIKEIHASGYATTDLRKNGNFLSKWKWKFNDYILSKYSGVVVLNEDEKKYQTIDNVVVIPNPIAIINEQAVLEKKQVLAAGRIAPVKGFNKLIEAWLLVYQQQPEWQLHIYGDDYGATKGELEKQINECHLQNVIFFKESVNDLPKTMLEYSVYVMSSITECFPMVLLEALSVGMPIVSFDCPNGPRHIITNQIDGLLVENQNTTALALGLLQLIENSELRNEIGENAKINSTNFATDLVMQQWLRLFKKLMKKS